jgi:hypothetical protein
MSTLLKKENILYNSVVNSETDKGTASAFYDYATFILSESTPLLLHIQNEMKERDRDIKEYTELYEVILINIKKELKSIEKLVTKLGLEDDKVIADRLRSIHEFINGDHTSSLSLDYFDNVGLNFLDILRDLKRNGYHAEIAPHVIISSGYNPFIKDAVAFNDREKYYALIRAFKKKQDITVVGALDHISKIFLGMNNLDSIDIYPREIIIDEVNKIHNSIILNNRDNLAKETKNNKKEIFLMKGEDIHHYEKGILTVKQRGIKDQKYIGMFKNILKYMPANRSEITITNFEKLVPREKKLGMWYKGNLMKDNIFDKYLGNNNLKNINPTTGEKILRVTDRYIYFNNTM